MPEAFSKCACRHCGEHIEFPSTGIGTTVLCPHCQQRTLLSVTPSAAFSTEEEMAAPRRGVPPWVFALLVVIAANAGAYWYFVKRPQSTPPPAPVAVAPKPAVTNVAPAPPPDLWHGLMTGPIQLEKVGDGNLIYAVGTVSNASDHERFGVSVDLDVYDAQKNKVGTAKDYTSSILPGKEWKFKALMTDRTAATVELHAVKEE